MNFFHKNIIIFSYPKKGDEDHRTPGHLQRSFCSSRLFVIPYSGNFYLINFVFIFSVFIFYLLSPENCFYFNIFYFESQKNFLFQIFFQFWNTRKCVFQNFFQIWNTRKCVFKNTWSTRVVFHWNTR
jgi:hypothetical protein